MRKTIDDAILEKTVNELTEAHGNDCRERALEGVRCAASLWREEDGTPADFSVFCLTHFAESDEKRSELFRRLESVFETLYGSIHAISRSFSWASHVDGGLELPVDSILSAWAPSAHLSDDFYGNKIAFVVHLNFPYRDFRRKTTEGDSWSRHEWAEARLGDYFITRLPAGASARLASAYSAAENYISAYNIFPAFLRDGGAPEVPLFAVETKLLMHWNMRDHIKSMYASPEGLRAQRVLYAAMEAVVDGSIPIDFINSRDLSWNPHTGAATFAESHDSVAAAPEGDGRYEKLLDIFLAERENDLWQADNPTHIDRKFNVDREIPEKDVEHLFTTLLSAPEFAGCAGLVQARMGRKLEPFDVWYRGFDIGEKPDEKKLDALTRSRYPDARAFKADIPRMLQVLGFDGKTSDWLAGKIEVDPARGSGHAMGCSMRSDKVHLRTRIPATGMDYKGFNIACHELGHNVEQVFSLHGIDEFFLAGVPNTAFTEAFAFVFQARDLLMLGAQETPRSRSALDTYWQTCEIAGVALLDMQVWRWMYAHHDCSARDLREAVIEISKSVWNRFFAPAFGVRDALALGTYSHMISSGLYLPDYPLGHIISHQIEAALLQDEKGPGNSGQRIGGMCRLGRLTPGQWMKEATGGELSVASLLRDAGAELDAL